MRKVRILRDALIATMFFCLCAAAVAANPVLHPRPSGYGEDGAPAKPDSLQFQGVNQLDRMPYDLVAEFAMPKTDPFKVDKVTINGSPAERFIVLNLGIMNKHRVVHGTEPFAIYAYSQWQPGKPYEVAVDGTSEKGTPVHFAVNAAAPESYGATSVGFGGPSPEFPYHHVTFNVPKEIVQPGEVTRVEVDGVWNRDARYFNEGMEHPEKKAASEIPEGESYTGHIGGNRNFRVVAPVTWTNGSKHAVKVTWKDKSGAESTYEAEGTAPASGGYWNADWPHFVSIKLHETAGLRREGEPVHLALGLFADDITDPAKEIRIVTYDPTNPKAGSDGYVMAPVQVKNVETWRDEKVLAIVEIDPETKERLHRYDATTTVELVFLADVLPYEERIYYVVYGNPKAEAPAYDSDLKITGGEGLSQTVENKWFRYFLSVNSGSVEQVTVLGNGDPVLLEHKLETNGAVHWNPDFYPPPKPWVHISDWEKPAMDQKTGPIMHRTERHAAMPFIDNVHAAVSYEFYAQQPYTVMTSLMEVQAEQFVQAVRNGELVFNHAVLNEFVWQDPLGHVGTLDVETSRKHPIHALEIPADTPWMALINREKGVGFAQISLAFECGNRYAKEPSLTQPYYYVQNGPWIYWSRPLVYPFGGMNFTRMMPVRKGSFYYERMAWVPFRFANGDDPFADIKVLCTKLNNPLDITEWMGTDARTPAVWVMPILTMPFDEGVGVRTDGSEHKE
ncbi:MAG: hypothetical protein AMXMBFR84_06520 [Candidatus Hydrogenedentota bacterium]